MIEPKPGARFTVRDEPINRDNAFWKPLIGKSGTITSVSPDDGLLDVAVGGVDDATFAEGIKAERFCIFEVNDKVASMFEPRPWWKRLMFWRRPVVKTRR